MSVTILQQADALSAPPRRSARPLHAVIEAVTILLVCLAPARSAPFIPLFEFVLLAASLLLVLWGLAIPLAKWQFTWKRCPVALCLAGLVLFGVFQLAPLPPEAQLLAVAVGHVSCCTS